MTTESIIKFVADEDVVDTIIRGQHTDLVKGLMELIMNCVDSGATTCTLTFNQDGFRLEDNGRGFGSYDNVMDRFKRLGKSHSEDNKPKFGRFGMGRGQIMPWGRICWASGEHRMTTDLNDYDGFKYAQGEPIDGCVVTGEFYDGLARYDFSSHLHNLIGQCRFIDSSISIVINNRTVNTADDETWDDETDDYRIRWHESRDIHDAIKVYNQGVFICDYPGHAQGLGGEIVAKKAMTLNMARNSIHPKDPVWNRICERVNEKIKAHLQAMQKRKAMTEDMRLPLINGLTEPDPDISTYILEEWKETFDLPGHRVSRLPLLRDSRGRYHHFDTLNHRPLTLVPAGSERLAESIVMQNLAVPVTRSELQHWNVETPEDLIDQYNEIVAPRLWSFAHPEHSPHRYRHLCINARAVPFEVIAATVDNSNTLLNKRDLPPKEAAARNALEYGSGVMAKRISNIDREDMAKRRVVVGESFSNEGWTDSSTFIAIDRKMLKILDRGLPGATQLALLLLHEYVHDSKHPDCNEHGELFYERFHDLASNHSKHELVANTARSIWGRYLTELNKKGLGLPESASGHPEADRTFVYRITLGPAGLSVMAKAVLDKIGLEYTLRNKVLTLKSNIDFLYQRHDTLHKWLLGQIPAELKIKSDVPVGNLVWLADDADPETKAAVEHYWQTVAKAWADKYTGDPASYLAAKKTLARSLRRLSPDERLLDFLIQDPATEVRHYESDMHRPMSQRTVGGPAFRFDLDVWEDRGLLQYDQVTTFDRESVKTNRGAREAYVLNRVKETLARILDPKERADLIATLQTEAFAQELKDAQ